MIKLEICKLDLHWNLKGKDSGDTAVYSPKSTVLEVILVAFIILFFAKSSMNCLTHFMAQFVNNE